MATTVKIKYVGFAEAQIERSMVWPICRTFSPNGSYIDSPVYTEGYPGVEGHTAADGEAKDWTYGKSVYATNVAGWGNLPGLLPMAHTVTRFAQFERAVMIAAEAQKKGTTNEGISFEVEGYEEELYWNQMAANMADQQFYIEVGETKYGTDITVSKSSTRDPEESKTEPSKDQSVDVGGGTGSLG